MENASKALVISGGVLVAILLLSIFAYLFNSMGNSTAKVYQRMEKHEIDEFNQQFLNFEGRGTTDSTSPLVAQDIATLMNLAKNSEKNSKYKTKVAIMLNGTDITSQNSSDWLKNNINSNVKYKCTLVHINTQPLLVDSVVHSQM